MTEPLSRVAYRAAEIAAERGHCKGTEEDDEGRVCLVGAINFALFGQNRIQLGYTHEVRDAQSRLLDAAGRVLARIGVDDPQLLVTYYTTVGEQISEGPVPHAISWNNRDEVTGEDVTLVLKRAGELLEADENDAR